ncbi:MAG: YggT family protein [Gemmatimonadales bacterium]|nr:YggT family protein [Gemmatimonadales bacterium]
MHERHEHVTRTEPAVATEHVETVATDPYAPRRGAASKVRQAIYLIFGIIEGLIAIRFVLRALGANPDAAFAAFVYGATAPFLVPFVGLFGTPQYNGSVLELHAIVAIVVYALLAWVLAKLAWLLLGETRSGVRTHASRVDTDVP